MAQEPNPFAAVLADVFGTQHVAPDAPTRPVGEPVEPGFAAGVGELTRQFGLCDADRRQHIVAAVNGALDDVGLDATVESLRYGNLVIRADPITSRLLKVHTGRLVRAADQMHPGVVQRVSVRARPGAPGRPPDRTRPRP